jgi:nitrate/nitrite-specific signal transduction histidine kinase
LARTIVQPLRHLVRASVRVRLGRDRTVVVPRLPDRGDEIGLLARALSDMTEALRQSIDGVEALPPMSRMRSRTRWLPCAARSIRWTRLMIPICAAN